MQEVQRLCNVVREVTTLGEANGAAKVQQPMQINKLIPHPIRLTTLLTDQSYILLMLSIILFLDLELRAKGVFQPPTFSKRRGIHLRMAAYR